MDSKERKHLFDRLSKLTKTEKKLMSDTDRQEGLLHRLDKMQELEKSGENEGHKKAKKDIWKKLGEQVMKKNQ